MLRKMFFGLAALAMLTAMMIPHSSAIASPDMQTITLNTGFNHDAIPQGAYSLILPPKPDLFWSVIQDPTTSATPHSAYAIVKHQAWAPVPAPFDSQWISYTGNGSTGIKQGAYVYQKCFCMTKALWDNKQGILQSSFDVSVRADDGFSLSLNGHNLLASGAGKGFYAGPPATLTITGAPLAKILQPGRNCLAVRVDDTGAVITGFNLVGTLTTTGIDGIAKGPKGEFNACSSCKSK